MADPFFTEEEEKKEEKEEVDKIKVGEEEFTAEELQEAVGAFKLKKEVEEKYDTKLDKIWPEFTKKSQELKELKEEAQTRDQEAKVQAATAEKEELERKQAEGEQLSPEEIRNLANKQGFITKDNVASEVVNILEGRRILNKAKKLETKGNPYDTKDLPAFETSDMFDWMSKTPGMGNVDPEVAYKIRFEPEIDSWKSSVLGKGKKSGLSTATGSQPGGKQPKPVKMTDDNLSEHVRAALDNEL